MQGKLGKGLYSTVQIPADQSILEMSGPVLLDHQIAGIIDEHWQIGPNTFIGPSGSVEDAIRHSCDPNSLLYIVGNRAILYSLYFITPGMEITVDYSVSSTDTLDTWQMLCKCGSNKCRAVISGHQYLSAELKEEYDQKGMLPLYIVQPGLIKKR